MTVFCPRLPLSFSLPTWFCHASVRPFTVDEHLGTCMRGWKGIFMCTRLWVSHQAYACLFHSALWLHYLVCTPIFSPYSAGVWCKQHFTVWYQTHMLVRKASPLLWAPVAEINGRCDLLSVSTKLLSSVWSYQWAIWWICCTDILQPLFPSGSLPLAASLVQYGVFPDCVSVHESCLALCVASPNLVMFTSSCSCIKDI